MNNACKLKWTFIQSITSVDLLNLTISINLQGTIPTKTSHDSMNFFLYIPPHWVHPPSLLRSFVYQQKLTYYKPKTKQSDFIDMITVLFQRLLDCGNSYNNLSILVTSAVTSIEQKMSSTFPQNNLTPTSVNQITNCLFIYLTTQKISHINKFATSTNLHANWSTITSNILPTTKLNVSW